MIEIKKNVHATVPKGAQQVLQPSSHSGCPWLAQGGRGAGLPSPALLQAVLTRKLMSGRWQGAPEVAAPGPGHRSASSWPSPILLLHNELQLG